MNVKLTNRCYRASKIVYRLRYFRAVQHRAGMDQSSKIISINTSIHAPINAIADYVVVGDVMKVIPK